MDPTKKLKEKGIISPKNKLKPGVIIIGFRELHVETNPIRFWMQELDDDMLIAELNENNTPPWAKPYIDVLSKLEAE